MARGFIRWPTGGVTSRGAGPNDRHQPDNCPKTQSECRRAAGDPVDLLDVTLLQKHVLAPIFGIDDPRTSRRIRFVGGIRGTAELEKLVNSGECACAFSMFPACIEDLMSIADMGEIMPPKSTWFEPKLRDGMFCHMI